MNTDQVQEDTRRYQLLKDYLLQHGFIRHHAVSTADSEPFVMGTHFYGPSFENAVDSL